MDNHFLEPILYWIIFLSFIYLSGIVIRFLDKKYVDKSNNVTIFKSAREREIDAKIMAENVINKISEATSKFKYKDNEYNNKSYNYHENEDDSKNSLNEIIHKYIGYTPNDIFTQNEPFNFPYVLMPNLHSIIKFPQDGRKGRKGVKEEDFRKVIIENFGNQMDVFDNKCLLSKSKHPYEPDLTLIYNKNDENIFIDVEIDEPYEGLNDVNNRAPTHYQYYDANRNNSFKNRGWIVIRFAEIQVHEQPLSCCLFIADVIKSICKEFVIPKSIQSVNHIKPVKQWTKDQSIIWSTEKYREKYLGINIFNYISITDDKNDIVESKSGELVELIVKDDPIIYAPPIKSKNEILSLSIKLNHYVSFRFEDEYTIVKPKYIENNYLISYCYIKNCDRKFDIEKIQNVSQKKNYFIVIFKKEDVDLSEVKSTVLNVIKYDRYLRIIYRPSNGATTTRTVSKIVSVNTFPPEDIKYYSLTDDIMFGSYCHFKMASRVFRFDRIKQVELLNI